MGVTAHQSIRVEGSGRLWLDGGIEHSSSVGTEYFHWDEAEAFTLYQPLPPQWVLNLLPGGEERYKNIQFRLQPPEPDDEETVEAVIEIDAEIQALTDRISSSAMMEDMLEDTLGDILQAEIQSEPLSNPKPESES